MTIDYNPRKRVLAAGTRDGNVVMWKNLAAVSSPPEDDAGNPNEDGSGKKTGILSSAATSLAAALGMGTPGNAAGGGYGAVDARAKMLRAASTADAWKCLPVVGLNGRIKGLRWGAGEQLKK